MPRKPLKPCAYPCCPKLTEGMYCDAHKQQREREYNIFRRDKQAQKFYSSPEWLKLRKLKLAASPLCEACRKAGKLTKAALVDHIIPIKQGGPPLDIYNLQSLCWSCHSRKSIKEDNRWK